MFRVQTFFDKHDNDCVSEVKELSIAVRMFRNSFRASGYLGDPGYYELIEIDSGLILGCWSLKLGLWASDAIVGYFNEAEIDGGMIDTIVTPFESSSQSERKRHGNC